MHRFRPRLSYANVVSTLCLVLVVGGGVAFAVNRPKDRTAKPAIVRQASVALPSGVEGGAQRKLLDLSGIGRLIASRGEFGPFGTVNLKNTSRAGFDIESFTAGTGPGASDQVRFESQSVPPGETAEFGGGSSRDDTYWVTVHPSNGKRATPQVEMVIHVSSDRSSAFVVSAKP